MIQEYKNKCKIQIQDANAKYKYINIECEKQTTGKNSAAKMTQQITSHIEFWYMD